jgi:hypothetical protein
MRRGSRSIGIVLGTALLMAASHSFAVGSEDGRLRCH